MVTKVDGSFPYRRIVADLRADISTGRRGPGDRLPSEHDLADEYGASRPTVRRAIAVLKAEGLIISEQGRGMFVRPKPHVRLLLSGANYRRHRGAGLPGFNAQVIEQGQTPQQHLLEVATLNATADVATQLDLDNDAEIVVRRRLFTIDGQPVSLCDSYYPGEMAKGTPISENHRISGGAHAVIEDPAGPIRRRIERSVDDLVCRMPTPEEIEGLKLPAGVPVVNVIRTVYDIDNRPVELQYSIAAADRHQFRYEVSMA